MMKTLRRTGFPLELFGVLPCMHDSRTNLSRQVETHLPDGSGEFHFFISPKHAVNKKMI